MITNNSEYSELTDRQFQLIGRLIIEFSNLETLLLILLNNLLLSVNNLKGVHFGQSTTHHLITEIEATLVINSYQYKYEIIPLDLSKRISEKISEIKNIKTIRNKLTHYSWKKYEDNKIIGVRQTSDIPSIKKPKVDTFVLSENKLENEVIRIQCLAENIENFLKELNFLKKTHFSRLPFALFRHNYI